MKLSSGRASTAPPLDSLVQGWYHDIGSLSAEPGCSGKIEGRINERRVRFDAKVTYRPIPLEGRGRKTPARGTSLRDRGGGSLDLLEEAANIYGDEECKCGGLGLFKGSGRTDAAEDADEDVECVVCARTWKDVDEMFNEVAQSRSHVGETSLNAPPVGIPAIAEEVVQSHSDSLQSDSFVKSHSGIFF